MRRSSSAKAGHVLTDDRLAENDAAENVADRPVRALPHFLQIELFDARFVRRDRSAFDAEAMEDQRHFWAEEGGIGGMKSLT